MQMRQAVFRMQSAACTSKPTETTASRKNHTTVIAACKRTEQMVAAGETVTFNDGSIERQVTASEIVEALEDQLRR